MRCTMKNGASFIFDIEDMEVVQSHTWSVARGHVRTTIDGRSVYLHQLLLGKSHDREIDHINGDKWDNSLPNLRIVTRLQNCRDGGFLTKLRNKKIDPVRIQRPYLLRYFDRMPVIKPALSRWKYEQLSRNDLQNILYLPKQELTYNLLLFYEVEIEFQL